MLDMTTVACIALAAALVAAFWVGEMRVRRLRSTLAGVTAERDTTKTECRTADQALQEQRLENARLTPFAARCESLEQQARDAVKPF